MTHLREQLSALVDGELNGAELDRANAHLAGCEQCRSEAAALRVLKRELRQLAAAKPAEDFTRRLMSMAGPGGPVPPRRQVPPEQRQQPAFRSFPDRRPQVTRRPPSRSGGRAPGGRRRPSRMLLGVLSILVIVGISAFGISLGIDGASGQGLSPGLAFYTMTHGFVPGADQFGTGHHPQIGPSPRSTGPVP